MSIENPDVQKLINDLGLTLIKPFRIADGGFVRSFVLLCADKKGAKKVLKIFASTDNGARRRFIKEIEILQRFHKNPQTRAFAIAIRKADIYPDTFIYYLMDFVEGQSFGEFVHDLGFKMGLFKKPTFEKFLGFWVNLNKMDKPDISNLHPYGYGRASGELHYYKEHTPNIVPAEKWLQVENYLREREKILDETKYLSHHDLYPENLFIKKPFSPILKVIDWEQAHLTSFGCNEAFLYLMFWKEEYFRRKIYALCREAEERDWESFKSYILLFAVRFLYQLETFVDKSLADYVNFKNFLVHTINDITSGNFDQPKNLQFLITKQQISHILKDIYGIKNDFIYEDFAPGFSNTMLKIKTMTNDGKGEILVLRIYKYDKKYQDVQNEVNAYNKLTEAGIKTYVLKKNINGEFISGSLMYGLNRHFILTSFLEGKVSSRVNLCRAKVLSAGKILRKMHDDDITHNDFNRRNLLYKGDSVSAVLDLEFAGFTSSQESKMVDLAKAVALWLMGIDEEACLKPQQVYNFFLEGYFVKDWSKYESVVHPLVIKAFAGLEEDYQRMQESLPSAYSSSYFENNIKHIEEMVRWLLTRTSSVLDT